MNIKKIYLSAESFEDNPHNQKECTDVIVLLENGKKYIASFFSFRCIEEIRQQNNKSGDFIKGLYFYNKNMVLIEECTMEAIEQVIEHLMDEGEFQEAFEQL